MTGFLLALIGREVWGWIPMLTRAVIWLETAVLPRDRRHVRRQEWLGELNAVYDDRRISGLIWALGLVRVCIWERATTPLSRPRLGSRRETHSNPPSSAARQLRYQAALATAAVLVWTATGLVWIIGAVQSAVTVSAAILFVAAVGVLARRQMHRSWKKHAYRRLPVLGVLEQLLHDSQAQSIQDLRALRADLAAQHDLILAKGDEVSLPEAETRTA